MGAGPHRLGAFAIIIAVLGLLTAWSVAFGTRENQGGLRAKAEANGNPIEAFKAIAQNDQLLWVALSYLLYSVANVATTGVLFYQFKYVLGAPDSFSIAGIIPVITGLGTTPLYRCSTAASRAAGCTPPAWRS